jgi:hypothetical protein
LILDDLLSRRTDAVQSFFFAALRALPLPRAFLPRALEPRRAAAFTARFFAFFLAFGRLAAAFFAGLAEAFLGFRAAGG